eukprot:g10587.t1
MAENSSSVGEGVEEGDAHAQVLCAVHQEFLEYGLCPTDQSMAENSSSVGDGVEEGDAHAQVLCAVHQEFLEYGLVPQQQQQRGESLRLTQSAAGAFPPLRYDDAGSGGRVVVVRALAMFDDLIVNATATSPRADDANGEVEVDVRRRIKLNVMTWSALSSAGGGGQAAGQVAGGVGGRDGNAQTAAGTAVAAEAAGGTGPGTGIGDESGTSDAGRETPGGAGTGTGTGGDNDASDAGRDTPRHDGAPAAASPALGATAAATPDLSPLSPLREAFRSRVLFGLLLHLCPPPGHFADLFGCGDELRQRILGLLGPRDLATFGLRSRAMQLMAFMGRRSRAPYPAGLPRGPYHTPGPPVFPGYDWGPGIGEGADVSPLSPPSSIWGRGGWPSPLRGWGRAPWRR